MGEKSISASLPEVFLVSPSRETRANGDSRGAFRPLPLRIPKRNIPRGKPRGNLHIVFFATDK